MASGDWNKFSHAQASGAQRLFLRSLGFAFLSNLGNLGLLSELLWAIWACFPKKSGQSALAFQGNLGNLNLLP